jgi:hypothetical protein
MIRFRASLFIDRETSVFCLCHWYESVIFEAEDSRGFIANFC